MALLPAGMLLLFAVTLFTSATLLFLVQPMVGKMILPMLGGTPAVWNTCMVFFQAMLLAGYAYAHATSRWLGVRKQAAVHLGLLLTPFLFLPLTVDARYILANTESPVPGLLLLLTASVGVPFLVVSASAPLLQKWFAGMDHPAAADPYFLYGASNLGSMLALLGYPSWVEPTFVLVDQRMYWKFGFILLAGLIAACAFVLWWAPPARVTITDPQLAAKEKAAAVTWAQRLRWIALAAVPSSLMLGATTYMTTDIAALPLLWVLPLALYLLTFIIVFAKVPVLIQRVSIAVLPVTVLAILFVMLSEIRPPRVEYTILCHLAVLFIVALVCHGELARSRPSTQYLTEFFLWMSFGGVVGGLFNALIAPLLFLSVIEYQLALLAACALLPASGRQQVGNPLSPNAFGETSSREEADNRAGLLSDAALAGVLFAIGLVLICLRLADDNLETGQLTWRNLRWLIFSALGLLAFACVRLARARQPGHAVLDLLLPISLAVLLVGLALGLDSEVLDARMMLLAKKIEITAWKLQAAIIYGLPLALCLTFTGRPTRFSLAVAALLLAGSFCSLFDGDVLVRERSFFGVMQVEKRIETDAEGEEHACHRLIHGTTLHGLQFLEPELRGDPVTYFHPTGGMGQVMTRYNGPSAALGACAGSYTGYCAWPGVGPKIAVIGLGTGTLAGYARPGQAMTFYEIDPLVRDLAFAPNEYFFFVTDAQGRGARLNLVLGDARLKLDEFTPAPADGYGILVVDAFSSDAIPIHLITREALEMYLARMRDDGIICFNISNRYLNLEPVLANLCAALGLTGYILNDRESGELGKTASSWVAIARRREHLEKLLANAVPDDEPAWQPLETKPAVGVWTDDYSNLLKVFEW